MKELEFSAEELAAFRAEVAKGATDEQFTLFIAECKRRGLFPGRQVYFQLRNAREWSPETNSYVHVKKATHLTSIDSLRLTAQRTGSSSMSMTWIPGSSNSVRCPSGSRT